MRSAPSATRATTKRGQTRHAVHARVDVKPVLKILLEHTGSVLSAWMVIRKCLATLSVEAARPTVLNV